jgi:hypothetical protein
MNYYWDILILPMFDIFFIAYIYFVPKQFLCFFSTISTVRTAGDGTLTCQAETGTFTSSSASCVPGKNKWIQWLTSAAPSHRIYMDS